MGEQFGFYIHTDRCVQCHACELACSAWNGLEPGVRWRKVMDVWSGRFPKIKNLTVSFSCMHCEKPSCMHACPEKAISKRMKDGIVTVDPQKCVGCRTCEFACPFQIPQYGKNGIMQKCHMCLDRTAQGLEPSCVATCPGEALQFGTVESLLKISALKSGNRLPSSTVPSLIISGKLTGSAILRMLERNRSA
ncbi:MAG: 4Fe-4S dicluster domain-containing protein [Acidobacteriota bacterium]